MNRSLKLLYRMLEELQKVPADIPRDETLAWETVHMISSARTAWILALSRGEDPELCACAAAVHDFGRIRNGVQAGHAEAGFLPVTAFLIRSTRFCTKFLTSPNRLRSVSWMCFITLSFARIWSQLSATTSLMASSRFSPQALM